MAIVFGIIWVLITQSMASINAFGWSFLFYDVWDPVKKIFGIRNFFLGTLLVAGLAMLLGGIIGTLTAIYLAELSPRIVREPAAFLIELLAFIPSVIYGLFGLLIFAPWLAKVGEPWLTKNLGFIPFLFKGPAFGVGILAAVLILTVMLLPLVVALTRQALLAVPNDQREAVLSVGCTHVGGRTLRDPPVRPRGHRRRHHPRVGARPRRNHRCRHGDRRQSQTAYVAVRPGLHHRQCHRQRVHGSEFAPVPFGADRSRLRAVHPDLGDEYPRPLADSAHWRAVRGEPVSVQVRREPRAISFSALPSDLVRRQILSWVVQVVSLLMCVMTVGVLLFFLGFLFIVAARRSTSTSSPNFPRRWVTPAAAWSIRCSGH